MARWIALLMIVGGTACTAARPVSGVRQCTTWKEDVAARFSERCAGCHGELPAAANYQVTTYVSTVGVGRPDGVVAVAGDVNSRLLAVLDPTRGDVTHVYFADLFPLASAWVVDCNLAYENSAVHAGGLMNPASEDFHGTLLQSRKWDFSLCQSCHGDDFSGGASGASCLTCHTEPGGPTACSTCHGQPPATGSHAAHAGKGALAKTFDCSECHIKPLLWSDAGHILMADGEVDPAPAEVNLGAFAQTATPERTAAPSYASGQCTNVYCHGGAQPVWGQSGSVVCGSCHGLPPAGHPGGSCETCHVRVATAQSGTPAIVNGALHIDGKISLGDDSGTCTACHKILSGAHNSHVNGTHQLALPLQCTECHKVPATVTDPGHLNPDGFPVVFPDGSSPIARADQAMPSWDAASLTCSGVECHGGGTKLGADMTPGLMRTPKWIGGSGAALCGACHGLPPADGVHDASWSLQSCYQCHAKTIDATGQLLPSSHINGVVDAAP